MNEENLVRKLRKRREQLGHSQFYLGKKLGMSQTNYSNIENGKSRLSAKMVAKAKEIEEYKDFDKEVAVPVNNLDLNLPSEEAVDEPSEAFSTGVGPVEQPSPLEPADNPGSRLDNFLMWFWGKRSRYVTIVVVCILLINSASQFVDDMLRGYNGEAKPDGPMTYVYTLFVFFLFAFFIYLIYLPVKWLLKKKLQAMQRTYKDL